MGMVKQHFHSEFESWIKPEQSGLPEINSQICKKFIFNLNNLKIL